MKTQTCENQHGFFPARSAVSNLVGTNHIINLSFPFVFVK